MSKEGDPFSEFRKQAEAFRQFREQMKAFNEPLTQYREWTESRQDPLEQHRKFLKSFSDPFKDYREQIEALRDPFKEHRDFVDSFRHPLKGYRERLDRDFQERRDLMKSFSDPLKEYRQQIQALNDPLKEYRDVMKSFGDPFKDYREQLKALGDPLKEFGSQLEALNLDSLFRYRAQLARSSSGILSDLEKSVRFFENLRPELWSATAAEIVTPREHLASSGRFVSADELQTAVDDVFNRAIAHSDNRTDRVLHALTEEIRRIRDPLLQRILTWLVFPIIVGLALSIANAVTDFYVKEALSDKRKLKKEIKQEVIRSFGQSNHLQPYRIVVAGTLNVRASAAVSSKQVATLQFGQIVQLVEKQKSWSLVRWHDEESSVVVQGWVFSRYLEKFK